MADLEEGVPDESSLLMSHYQAESRNKGEQAQMIDASISKLEELKSDGIITTDEMDRRKDLLQAYAKHNMLPGQEEGLSDFWSVTRIMDFLWMPVNATLTGFSMLQHMIAQYVFGQTPTFSL